MPLLKTEKISESKIWGIWKLSEPMEEIFSMVHSESEDEGHLEIAHPNKKMEWAGTRVLTKELCREMNWGYPGISKDEFGKPYFNDWSLGISVSHKFPYVIVMLDKFQDVGIDIEPVNDKILKIGHKFMNEVEIKWAFSPLEITIVWAAKEALYKLHGRRKVLFKDQLFVEFLEGDERSGKLIGWIVDDGTMQYELVYQMDVDDMLIVYSI
ncbi:MAG: 4'-phosphopantetheinyl transferase superfamily protein [Cyclobacteriaceae bacterium]|nr:4'-phosphopantetheinyl transferase superfamily protein [Cyclobacteriaceae bacterium]